MAQKIGRNAPCPCGSGLKFKKCCATDKPAETSPQEYDQLLRDARFTPIVNASRNHRATVATRPVPSLVHENKRVRIVCNRVYFRELKETFHEFLIHLLQSTLGKEWHDEQRSLPFEERHQIFKWFHALSNFTKSLVENPRFQDGEHYGDSPTGDAQAVTALAYDLFHVLNAGPLPNDLIKALKE